MASIKKITHSAVVNQLRHVLRETANPANISIDVMRSHLNYTLSPDRGMHPYSYYQQRKSRLYCFGRADVKTLVGCVVTAPKDLPIEQQQKFFHESYLFLENRYGQENTVLAVVHYDETSPHLHYLFIPVVSDPKHGGEKICANDLITRVELRDFHPALKKHLNSVGIHAHVIHDISSKSYDGRSYKPERKFERLLREGRDKKC